MAANPEPEPADISPALALMIAGQVGWRDFL
jgi:hypothetical protein